MESPSFRSLLMALGHQEKLLWRFTCLFFLVFLGLGVFNGWWLLLLPHQRAFQIASVATLDAAAVLVNGSNSRDRSDMLHGPGEASRPRHSPISSQGDICDLSRGQWVRDSTPPLYTNNTCKYILGNQNCMMNGRPDRGFLYWKWKPVGCELQSFSPRLFLEMMSGKKMVFIGDSIARNQMQALLCALAQVEDPINLYYDGKEKEYTWEFPRYNFTVANSWSPFLVNHSVKDEIYKLHLDKPDVVWATPFADYDVAIISTGYWFFRPSIYQMSNNTILGSNRGSELNLTRFDMLHAMEIALEAVLKHMVDSFNGITILRTVTVPHFENGSWSEGGSCNRREPYHDAHMRMPLPWMSNAIHGIQAKAYTKALVRKHGSIPFQRLKLMDITYSALLRPDGHPGPYRIQKPNEPVNDCLHWCLPGPIDMWSQFLMEIVRPYFQRVS